MPRPVPSARARPRSRPRRPNRCRRECRSRRQSREALIDEEVQIQIERLVERAAKVGAWGQAEEYCRARFTGAHLTHALTELRQAEDEALRKKAERQAA